ncbi:MAG: DUF4198 domain-containing protein, partial [Steroidobacteraceae bacterium]
TAAIGPVSAAAHEFWAEPTRFVLATGGAIGVRLCLGDGFEGTSLPRNPARIERFVATGPTGELPVVGLDGADPAGVVRLSATGGYVVAYGSDRAFTEIPEAEFERYAREKGLKRIVAARGAVPARAGKVREAYSRHAKALVRVGAEDVGAFDRPMGLGLELVAESLPESAAGAVPSSFRLLYEGEPLAGALVTATKPGTAEPGLAARTGVDGRVGFHLRSPGMWRLAAVHLVVPPRKLDADWESLWASLTFELAPRGGERTPAARVAHCRNRLPPAAAQARS